jgi:hypothetical protein
MSCLRRVIVGASGSPGNLGALRYAEHLATTPGIPQPSDSEAVVLVLVRLLLERGSRRQRPTRGTA